MGNYGWAMFGVWLLLVGEQWHFTFLCLFVTSFCIKVETDKQNEREF